MAQGTFLAIPLRVWLWANFHASCKLQIFENQTAKLVKKIPNSRNQPTWKGGNPRCISVSSLEKAHGLLQPHAVAIGMLVVVVATELMFPKHQWLWWENKGQIRC